MNKIVSYKILPDLKLIIEFVSGRISTEDALELKNREIQDKDYNPNYNFIVIITDLESFLEDIDIEFYINIIQKNDNIIGERKSVILTSNPKQVVIGTIYESAARNLPMNFNIVSTIERALHWVDLSNKHKSDILDIIEQMKKNSA